MAKGSQFERDVCRQLSLWWTQDEDPPRDDVFWRTSNSGGRATSRRKKGKKTANQSGDICAVDPVGVPFLKMFALEIKRGYGRHTLSDILDASAYAAEQKWAQWIEQAEKSSRESGSLWWMTIAKRDRREAIVVIPDSVCAIANPEDVVPSIKMLFDSQQTAICAFQLDAYLRSVDPENIKMVIGGKI